jgi:hypothetical protein
MTTAQGTVPRNLSYQTLGGVILCVFFTATGLLLDPGLRRDDGEEGCGETFRFCDRSGTFTREGSALESGQLVIICSQRIRSAWVKIFPLGF